MNQENDLLYSGIPLRCGKKLPGLMCMHIPLPEMWLVTGNRNPSRVVSG